MKITIITMRFDDESNAHAMAEAVPSQNPRCGCRHCVLYTAMEQNVTKAAYRIDDDTWEILILDD